MQPQIQIQEPFKKSWSVPRIIVTREDVMNYETSQKQKCTQQWENINARKSKIQSMMTNEQNEECLMSTEMLQDRLMDLQNTLLQSQIVRRQLQTPKKYFDNTHDSNLIFRSDVSNTNSQVYDRISPLFSMSMSDVSTTSSKFCDRISQQHSMSGSLPSSPLTGEIPTMMSSPTIPSNPERHFNFVPERLRFREETRHLTESDEVDNGFRLYQGSCYSPQGSGRCHNALHMSSLSPRTGRTVDSLHYKPESCITEAQLLRAKRKLDMDDPYSTSVKRAKSDVSQDAGLRYVNQLEMDLMSLKHRIQCSSPESFSRHTNCTCTEMEKHFMEMATSAYKSIRRYDGTVHSFEQFKAELTETNKVIKDSMELLQNVRRLCVH